MEVIAAYGLVAAASTPVSPRDLQRTIVELARSAFPEGAIAVSESQDRGSLVSQRPERFSFVRVTTAGRVFSFCRFRQFGGGIEFVFNLSDGAYSSQEIEEHLTAALDLEITRRELL